MTKDTIKYIALTKAVTSFTSRHHVDRGHFADILGYRGDNASVQFSNTLSPNTDKTFNSMREKLLLDALDIESLRIYFDERMRQYGLETKMTYVSHLSNVNFHMVVDDAMIEGDEAFKVSKMALRDDTLDEAELRAMMKEHDEASKKHREAYEMAEARLIQMRDA